ncbi:hypothetical protein GGH96_005167 [Coemansia sp. RSA 1972]|nr:hypothetical protein GGH96_005167 [Coemansia sp. RSA 1972]
MPQRLPKPAVWAFVAGTVSVPLVIVCVIVALFVQSSRTLVTSVPTSGTQNGHTQYRSWPESCSYEAKVFASLEAFVPSNATAFFESAQLLWHIEPQSLHDKYPKLTKQAHVDIPQQLRTVNHNSMLFAHMFVQEAGQFTPYPNMSNPRMVHSTTILTHWDAPTASSDDILELLEDSTDTTGHQLVAAESLPWAIMLENHAIKPVYASSPFSTNMFRSRWANKMAATYNPPLFINLVSKSRSKQVQLAEDGDSIPHTFSVNLELAGLTKTQLSIKAALTLIFTGQFRSVFRSDNVIELSRTASDDWMQSINLMSATTAQNRVYKCSIYAVLGVVIAMHFMVMFALVSLSISVLFWTSPALVLTGVSRTTLYMTITSEVLQLLQSALHSDSVLDGLMDVSVIVNVYVVARMLGAPRNPFKWPCLMYQRIGMRKQPIAAIDGNTRPDILTEKDRPIQQPAHLTRIIDARKSVDAQAVRWIKKLFVPVAVCAGILALFENEYSPLSWSYVDDAGRWIAIVIVSTCLVPQIMLNHRLRTASLLPPSGYVFVLVVVFAQALMSSITDDEDDSTSIYMVPYYVCNVVVLLQWMRYKAKQD